MKQDTTVEDLKAKTIEELTLIHFNLVEILGEAQNSINQHNQALQVVRSIIKEKQAQGLSKKEIIKEVK